VKREAGKYPYQEDLGFRVVGMKCGGRRRVVVMDKQWGRGLTPMEVGPQVRRRSQKILIAVLCCLPFKDRLDHAMHYFCNFISYTSLPPPSSSSSSSS